MKPHIIQLIVVVLGACFGSFITAASWRLPRGEDVISEPSHCPKCGARLKVADLIPVFSWLSASGKCRHCAAPVSFRYPLVEIVTAAIFFGLYIKYALSADFIILSFLAVALLTMMISDFETYVMPDSTTVVAGVLAVIYHYLNNSRWEPYILGAAACITTALALKYGFLWLMKRDALGWGDIKFLPVAGLWVGLPALPLFFILSGVFGILIGVTWRLIYKNAEYPFGPALALALLITVIFPELGFAQFYLPEK